MKTLDLSAVTPSVGIIPQKDTVEHITSSYLEGVASLAKSMIPESWQTGKLVILHGCVATGSNPAPRTLTAGAVFYNGEVYQVPAASFTTTGLQIGIWTLQDVNTGTESKLTDGSDVHVLVDNKFVFDAGLAGSGLFDEGEEYSIRKTKLSVNNFGTNLILSVPDETSILCAQVDLDVNSEYSTSTGRFTPKREGYYSISSSIKVFKASGSTPVINCNLLFKKNNVVIRNVMQASLSSINENSILSNQKIIYMNGSTDYFELKASQDTGSDTTNWLANLEIFLIE